MLFSKIVREALMFSRHMTQFTVPQFIDVEDKIIGPITTRQFIIMLVIGFIIFVLYKLLATLPFVILAVLLLAIGGTISFVRINGQPFHFFLLNIIQTTRSPNLQIWDKNLTDSELKMLIKQTPPPPKPLPSKKEIPTESRLNEIALTVDTGGVYTSE